MRRLTRRSIVLAALGALAAAGTARAQLNLFEAVSIVESTSSDTDASLLPYLAGLGPVTPLAYSSINSASGWTATLAGSYQGTPLSLSYTGDSSAYSTTGTINWSASGSYGATPWSDTGTSTITSTATSFSMTYMDSILVGTNTFVLNYTIPGSILADGTIMMGSPGDEEVGTGTTLVNGMLDPDRFSYKMVPKPGIPNPKNPSDFNYVKSDIIIFGVPVPYPPGWDTDNGTLPYMPSPYGGLTGIIVPEPSTFALLGLGALAALPALRRGRRRTGP